jgi:predicted transcriptional regulator
MPLANGLSDSQEAVLFAIWKLRGIGTSVITESQLKAQVTDEQPEAISAALSQLQAHGFVHIDNKNDRKTMSITPLGVAILRKIEEDRLQEI